eukprot:1175900-Prorocentrum_minimum.AAC.4
MIVSTPRRGRCARIGVQPPDQRELPPRGSGRQRAHPCVTGVNSPIRGANSPVRGAISPVRGENSPDLGDRAQPCSARPSHKTRPKSTVVGAIEED